MRGSPLLEAAPFLRVQLPIVVHLDAQLLRLGHSASQIRLARFRQDALIAQYLLLLP